MRYDEGIYNLPRYNLKPTIEQEKILKTDKIYLQATELADDFKKDAIKEEEKREQERDEYLSEYKINNLKT
jgi:hypothetical protein